MTTHSSTLARRIPWMEEPGGLQSMGSQRDTTERLHFHFSLSCIGEWNGGSSILAWRIPGTGEPGGLPSIGLHRVEHDWSDLASAAAVAIPFHELNKSALEGNYLNIIKAICEKSVASITPQWWKTESLSSKIRNKAKMPILTISI